MSAFLSLLTYNAKVALPLLAGIRIMVATDHFAGDGARRKAMKELAQI
jgi:hypothetical protein